MSEDYNEKLMRALDDPVPDVAASAARILGVRRTPKALEALFRLSTSHDPERAEAALEALAFYDDARVDARLVKACMNGTARERFIARTALRRRVMELHP